MPSQFLHNLYTVNTLSYKSRMLNSETRDKKWYVVDAEGQVLGRLSSRIALIIRGKHKPGYTPHTDCGDNVIVLNADKVVMTANKVANRTYLRHTGFPGGQRSRTAQEILNRHPERLIEHAVKGMLPKNRLGRRLFTNLYVYTGTEHPHVAQQPKELKLDL
ncbi:MAG: ribosomal protein [Bacteroidota bacterium]